MFVALVPDGTNNNAYINTSANATTTLQLYRVGSSGTVATIFFSGDITGLDGTYSFPGLFGIDVPAAGTTVISVICIRSC